jgi:hypothetical protein
MHPAALDELWLSCALQEREGRAEGARERYERAIFGQLFLRRTRLVAYVRKHLIDQSVGMQPATEGTSAQRAEVPEKRSNANSRLTITYG